MQVLVGMAISPGFGMGPAFVYRGDEYLFSAAERSGAEEEIVEAERFDEALRSTRRELQALSGRLEHEYGHAEAHVLRPQFLMLEDPMLIEGIQLRLARPGTSAEAAVAATVREIEGHLAATEDPYLRERAADVHDIGTRLLRHLADRRRHPLVHLPPGAVIVASRLLPSDTAFLDRSRVSAIVTERGGEHSHAAILARGLGIPAVSLVEGVVAVCQDGDPIAVDGIEGRVILNPMGRQGEDYSRRAHRYETSVDRARDERREGAVTRDGVEVRLMANIGRVEDLPKMRLELAQGIGLLRTEFLFLHERRAMSEDDQAAVYRQIAEACGEFPLTIRTLDLAPDKLLPMAGDLPLVRATVSERGVHYCLRHLDLFRPQLRAILRASGVGNIRILLPMVTGVREIRAVHELLESLRRELVSQGHDVAQTVPVGAMIETPPAALMTDEIVAASDFASVGSNDLLHYLFAAERAVHEDESGSVFEPSLLRAIDRVVRAGAAQGKEVGLCGEMAGTPALTSLLIGLGLRVFSMSPNRLTGVRYNVCSLDSAQAREMAVRALRLTSADEVRSFVLGQANAWRELTEGNGG